MERLQEYSLQPPWQPAARLTTYAKLCSIRRNLPSVWQRRTDTRREKRGRNRVYQSNLVATACFSYNAKRIVLHERRTVVAVEAEKTQGEGSHRSVSRKLSLRRSRLATHTCRKQSPSAASLARAACHCDPANAKEVRPDVEAGVAGLSCTHLDSTSADAGRPTPTTGFHSQETCSSEQPVWSKQNGT